MYGRITYSERRPITSSAYLTSSANIRTSTTYFTHITRVLLSNTLRAVTPRDSQTQVYIPHVHSQQGIACDIPESNRKKTLLIPRQNRVTCTFSLSLSFSLTLRHHCILWHQASRIANTDTHGTSHPLVRLETCARHTHTRTHRSI